MVIIVMGAAAAGKTTVGRRLSRRLGWLFLDGDALHPAENIAKMASGIPLSDEDRRPWLQALRNSVGDWIASNMNAVLACSLLTKNYRTAVLSDFPTRGESSVKLVYLRASRALLHARLAARTGHFAGVALLDSQLALLEEPADALTLDASQSPGALVDAITRTWNL